MNCIEALTLAKASPGKVGARCVLWVEGTGLRFDEDTDDWEAYGDPSSLWIPAWQVLEEWLTVPLAPSPRADDAGGK